jgi:glycosyltransferase involved in cell wall biosynthesis
MSMSIETSVLESPVSALVAAPAALPRLAVIATHPIQYYAPLYRSLARSGKVDLRVFFCSRMGLEAYFDAGFGETFSWKGNLLEGYQHEFLEDDSAKSSNDLARLDNPSVVSRLAAFRPDCVFIQGYSVKTMRRALYWAERNNIASLLFADSTFPDHVRFPKSWLKKAVLQFLYGNISGFFYMGDGGRAYHIHYGASADRLFFCPYTIDEQHFEPFRRERALTRARFKAELGLADDDVAFLFCGKLIGRKRAGDILRAVSQIADRKTRDRMVLLFSGDGVLRQRLQSEAAAAGLRTHFLGFRNLDGLPEVYCAADALILPSEREAYGVVLAEAAFFDLPLIVAEGVGAAGPGSLVRHGENGIVVPVGDTRRLGEAMQALLDPARRTAMGLRSRELYELQNTAICVRNIITAIETVTRRGAQAARNCSLASRA